MVSGLQGIPWLFFREGLLLVSGPLSGCVWLGRRASEFLYFSERQHPGRGLGYGRSFALSPDHLNLLDSPSGQAAAIE
jgi:hypothetical protein